MKKIIKIISVSGLALLTLLTFVSRSVYNKNLPQVTAYAVDRTFVPLTIETVAELYYKHATEIKVGNGWRISDVNVKDGDFVKAGDLLLTLDTTDHDIQTMSQELELLRLQNTIAAHVESAPKAETVSVKAPFDGILLMAEPVKVGQKVDKGTELGRYADDSAFAVTFPFHTSYRDVIKTGMSAEVTLSKWMTTVNGTVSSVSKVDYSRDGARVFDVEVTIDNPGALNEGNIAFVQIYTANGEAVLANDTGVLRCAREEILTAPISGTVIAFEKGVYRKGGTLITIREELQEKDERDWSRRFDELSAQLNLLLKQIEKDKAYPSGGRIYAETDGYVAGLAVKQGDTLPEGSIVLTLLPDETPRLKFDLPPKEGEAFGSEAVVSALIETITTNDDGESKFSRRTVTGRVSTGVLSGDHWECEAYLNAFDGQPVYGQNVPVQVEQRGAIQNYVVPVGCIFDEQNNTKVVYVINTRHGLFGEESYLTETPVTVLYDNGDYASLDSEGLYWNMILAGNPSQLISSGDTVWVRD